MWFMYAGFAAIGVVIYLIAAVVRGEFVPSLLIAIWDVMGLLVLFGPVFAIWSFLKRRTVGKQNDRLIVGALFIVSALVYVLMINSRQDILRAL